MGSCGEDESEGRGGGVVAVSGDCMLGFREVEVRQEGKKEEEVR